MQLVLTSVKDYCKKHNISDSGARKRVKQELVKSVTLEDNLYIIEESEEVALLKNKLKLSAAKVRELKKDSLLYTNQDELIKEQKAKIETLENKLESQRDSKESLYEKVIAHMTTFNQIEQK